VPIVIRKQLQWVYLQYLNSMFGDWDRWSRIISLISFSITGFSINLECRISMKLCYRMVPATLLVRIKFDFNVLWGLRSMLRCSSSSTSKEMEESTNLLQNAFEFFSNPVFTDNCRYQWENRFPVSNKGPTGFPPFETKIKSMLLTAQVYAHALNHLFKMILSISLVALSSYKAS